MRLIGQKSGLLDGGTVLWQRGLTAETQIHKQRGGKALVGKDGALLLPSFSFLTSFFLLRLTCCFLTSSPSSDASFSLIKPHFWLSTPSIRPHTHVAPHVLFYFCPNMLVFSSQEVNRQTAHVCVCLVAKMRPSASERTLYRPDRRLFAELILTRSRMWLLQVKAAVKKLSRCHPSVLLAAINRWMWAVRRALLSH